MSDLQWPYGTGGACGEKFAVTMALMREDIERIGIRACLDLWIETGLISPVVREVLSEADIQCMEQVDRLP